MGPWRISFIRVPVRSFFPKNLAWMSFPHWADIPNLQDPFAVRQAVQD
jgi:hypothetical protein